MDILNLVTPPESVMSLWRTPLVMYIDVYNIIIISTWQNNVFNDAPSTLSPLILMALIGTP